MVCDINETGTRYLKLSTKWKTTYLLGCWLRILFGDGLHLWLLGALVYLTLFGINTVKNSWGVNLIPRDFRRNIQLFWFYVFCDIDKTGTRALKLATKWNTTYLFCCWLRISSGDGLHLWLLGAIVYLTLFGIYSLHVMVNYHFHGENRVITR